MKITFELKEPLVDGLSRDDLAGLKGGTVFRRIGPDNRLYIALNGKAIGFDAGDCVAPVYTVSFRLMDDGPFVVVEDAVTIKIHP